MRSFRDKTPSDKKGSPDAMSRVEEISSEQPAKEYFPQFKLSILQNNTQAASPRGLDRGFFFQNGVSKSKNATPRAIKNPSKRQNSFKRNTIVNKNTQNEISFKQRDADNESNYFFPLIPRLGQPTSTVVTPRDLKDNFSFNESPKRSYLFRMQSNFYQDASPSFSSALRKGSGKTNFSFRSELNPQSSPKNMNILNLSQNRVKSPRQRFINSPKHQADAKGPYLLKEIEQLNFGGDDKVIEEHGSPNHKIDPKNSEWLKRNDKVKLRNLRRNLRIPAPPKQVEMDSESAEISQVLKSEALNLNDREAYKKEIFSEKDNIAILKKLLHP